MPNVLAIQKPKPISNEPARSAHFKVMAGQESIPLPDGWKQVSRVWLLDIRRRPVHLAKVPLEEMAEMGRKFATGDGGVAQYAHLRGLPACYAVAIGGRRLMLWPVPAHDWPGEMQEGIHARAPAWE
jgi:hypothetical protein